MRIVSSLAFTLGLLAAGACGKSSTAPSLKLPVAEAMASCAPADGPAVALRFTSSDGDAPTPPIVHVAVYRSRTELAGRQWQLPSDQAQAWIQRTTALENESATEGTIAFDAVDADGTIRGSITARFTDGTRFSQRFRATWVPRTMLCG